MDSQRKNSTVILNFRSCLVNKYLSKGFFIISNNYKQLFSIPNDMKLRIYAIDQLKTYFVMAKNTEISSVTYNIKKLHIQSNLNLIHKQNLYHDKQDEIYELFDEYHIPLLNHIDHPALIGEWKKS